MRNYRKLNTKIEVADEILERYKGVKELCSDEWGEGSYAHLNGVGCAIGCLMPAESAAMLPTESVKEILANEIYSFERDLIRCYVSEEVDSDFLESVQCLHDNAFDVDEFVYELEMLRATLLNESKSGQEESNE